MPGTLFSGVPLEFPILRKDMWNLTFPPAMNISERFLVKASRPKWTNSNKEIKYKNTVTFYKGATKFEPITIEFRDVVGPSVMQKIVQWQREHYDFVTGCGSYPSIYKKNLVLTMEDECGNAVQKWILYGCFITAVDGGDLDMESDADPATVSITVQPDSCQLEF